MSACRRFPFQRSRPQKSAVTSYDRPRSALLLLVLGLIKPAARRRPPLLSTREPRSSTGLTPIGRSGVSLKRQIRSWIRVRRSKSSQEPAVMGASRVLIRCWPRPQTPQDRLACISRHPTVEAHDTTAMASLRLLAVLDVLSSTPARAKRRAPRPDGPLTHFASPRGETCRLTADRSPMRGAGR